MTNHPEQHRAPRRGADRGTARPEPGLVLGDRYRLGDEIGTGGMARVFEATDLRLGRAVAVKVFRADLAEAIDPQRTTRETQLLAGVDHPSVVSVLDASPAGSPMRYLVMELVDGRDLGTLLQRGPLKPDLGRRIVADVAGALAILHARGVVHRDVKPANILVLSDDETERTGITAKLTDFGIARAVDASRITTADSILGTAAYLSPEQVRGEGVGPASDVYSLGLVLAEAVSGARAFPGPAAEAAVARLAGPPPLPLHASPGLAALLARMTAMDPAARPSAAEVAEALHGELAGGMTGGESTDTAPVPLLPVPPLAPVATAAALPAAAAMFEAAPAAADDGAFAALVGGVPSGDDEGSEPQRRHPLLAAGIGALSVAVVAGVGLIVSASALQNPLAVLPVTSPATAGGTVPAGSGATAAPSVSPSAVPTSASPTPTPRRRAPAPATSSAAVAPPAPVSSSPATTTTSSAPSSSPTSSPTRTATPTPTPTRTATPTPTPTPTRTSTPTPTPTATATATPTPTPTPKPTKPGKKRVPGGIKPGPAPRASGGATPFPSN